MTIVARFPAPNATVCSGVTLDAGRGYGVAKTDMATKTGHLLNMLCVYTP